MKQTISPPWHNWIPSKCAALLMFLGIYCAGTTEVRAQASPLNEGSYFQLRGMDYGYDASRRGTPAALRRDLQTGVELLYERVGQEGRGTRYLAGWVTQWTWGENTTSSGEIDEYRSIDHTWRIGYGKSQAYHYNRLVLKGGIDAIFSFQPGVRTRTLRIDANEAVSLRSSSQNAPEFRLGIRPFLGIGFQATSRFAIGIESGLNAGLRLRAGNSQRYQATGASAGSTSQSEFLASLYAGNSNYYPYLTFTFQL